MFCLVDRDVKYFCGLSRRNIVAHSLIVMAS